ncbi:hypothetical protein D3C81_1993970 [compost metagenome]
MVRIVVFLADQHPGGRRQLLHHLLRADQLTIGEVDNMPQVGVATPLTALPAGQRWLAGLTATQDQGQA